MVLLDRVRTLCANAYATGQAGNGHPNGTKGPLLRDLRTPLPRWRVGTKTLLAALGRNDAEGLRALMDGLVRCAKSENPWVTLALWRDLRDVLEGHPGKAPEAPAERQLRRIVLHPGPDPSAPPGEHYEDGERFVSVPPRAE